MTQGAKTESPTEFVDIFPTLCDLAGLDGPAELQGKSLVPILKDSQSSVKEVAISQYSRSKNGKPLMGYAYRSKRYRYVEWIQKAFRESQKRGPVVARELYDYEKDPNETVNVVDQDSYREIVTWFEQIVEKSPNNT